MREQSKLDVLDGLRGLAALLVVVFHFRLTCGRVAEPSWFARGLMPFRFGFSGVNLFLVLSGFCLTLSLVRRRAAGEGPSLRAFLLDRWRRIAPPFYAAAVVYLAAAPLLARAGVPPTGTTGETLGQLLSHATFLHGLWPETICGINDPFWSLSLEFQFYATLPLLFAVGLKLGPWRVLACVAAASIAWRVWILSQSPDRFHAVNGFFLARWAEFALGSALASWYSDPARRQLAASAPWAAASASLLLLAFASWLALRDQVLWSDYAFGLGYGALLASALLSGGRGAIGGALSCRPLRWVGETSYSLYLTHSLVLALVLAGYRATVARPDSATDLAALAIALGGSLAAGWGFASLFESPWHRRRRPQPPEPARPLLPADPRPA